MTGESDIALAGGVDILLDENPYLILSEARALRQMENVIRLMLRQMDLCLVKVVELYC